MHVYSMCVPIHKMISKLKLVDPKKPGIEEGSRENMFPSG